MLRILGWDKQILKTPLNYGCKKVNLHNVWPMWQMNVLKWWFVNVNRDGVNEYKLKWNDLWVIERSFLCNPWRIGMQPKLERKRVNKRERWTRSCKAPVSDYLWKSRCFQMFLATIVNWQRLLYVLLKNLSNVLISIS